jgi:hypothetical protein
MDGEVLDCTERYPQLRGDRSIDDADVEDVEADRSPASTCLTESHVWYLSASCSGRPSRHPVDLA